MAGKVTVWKMTEEERLAYIEKYPIKQTDKTKLSGYGADYDWRPEKAVESRKKAREAAFKRWEYERQNKL